MLIIVNNSYNFVFECDRKVLVSMEWWECLEVVFILHSVQLVGYVSLRVGDGSRSVSSGPSYPGHSGL